MSDWFVILVIVLAVFIIARIAKRRKRISLIEYYVDTWRKSYPEGYEKIGRQYSYLSGLPYKELDEIYNSLNAIDKKVKEEEQRVRALAVRQYQIEKEYTAFRSWHDRQKAFYEKCVAHAPKSFGRIKRLIDVKGIDKDGKEITQSFPVCHLFAHSIPPREYIDDYGNDNAEKEYPNSYPLFYESFHHSFIEALSLMDNIDGEQKRLPEDDYTNILSVTSALASDDTAVLLIDTTYGDKEEFRERVYSVIKKQLVAKGIQCFNIEDVKDYPLQYIRKNNLIIIEFLSFADEVKLNCHTLFNNVVHTYTKQLQNADVSLAYISVYNELSISYVAKRMDTQIQKDKELYDKLLKEGTLLSHAPWWGKTGIVRLFFREQADSQCLILASDKYGVRFWKDELSKMGVDEYKCQVESIFDYEHSVEPFYNLLVFDITDTLETGTRATICTKVFADYVLTLGSVSDEDEEMMRKVWKRRALRHSCTFYPQPFVWDYVPQCKIPYSFFVRYYPTSLQGFEANDDEWRDRWFIWNFKNNPDKQKEDSPYYHKQALDDAIDMLEERLNQTFGKLLPELTLVCVPASSPKKNEARYKAFSERLCEATGMSNAYSHITVTEEAVERHEGGEGVRINTVLFDWDYFNGRCILLFDDVLTTGGSMRRYAERFASHGAEVIACMTLGKTFHHREEGPEEIEFD